MSLTSYRAAPPRDKITTFILKTAYTYALIRGLSSVNFIKIAKSSEKQ